MFFQLHQCISLIALQQNQIWVRLSSNARAQHRLEGCWEPPGVLGGAAGQCVATEGHPTTPARVLKCPPTPHALRAGSSHKHPLCLMVTLMESINSFTAVSGHARCPFLSSTSSLAACYRAVLSQKYVHIRKRGILLITQGALTESSSYHGFWVCILYVLGEWIPS